MSYQKSYEKLIFFIKLYFIKKKTEENSANPDRLLSAKSNASTENYSKSNFPLLSSSVINNGEIKPAAKEPSPVKKFKNYSNMKLVKSMRVVRKSKKAKNQENQENNVETNQDGDDDADENLYLCVDLEDATTNQETNIQSEDGQPQVKKTRRRVLLRGYLILNK